MDSKMREAFEKKFEGDHLGRNGGEYENPFLQSAWDGMIAGAEYVKAAQPQQDKLIALIADDAYAATFQSMGQYRSALLAAATPDATKSPAVEQPVSGAVDERSDLIRLLKDQIEANANNQTMIAWNSEETPKRLLAALSSQSTPAERDQCWPMEQQPDGATTPVDPDDMQGSHNALCSSNCLSSSGACNCTIAQPEPQDESRTYEIGYAHGWVDAQPKPAEQWQEQSVERCLELAQYAIKHIPDIGTHSITLAPIQLAYLAGMIAKDAALSSAPIAQQTSSAVGVCENARNVLYSAAINCRHTITCDEVILCCDDRKPGNALAQLADRLVAAYESMTAPIAPAQSIDTSLFRIHLENVRHCHAKNLKQAIDAFVGFLDHDYIARSAIAAPAQDGETAKQIETLKQKLAECRVKHEVACSTLEIMKDHRTTSQKVLAAQCAEMNHLRAQLSTTHAPVDAQPLAKNQREKSWFLVTEVLDKVVPYWHDLPGRNGIEKAVKAIERLAAHAAEIVELRALLSAAPQPAQAQEALTDEQIEARADEHLDFSGGSVHQSDDGPHYHGSFKKVAKFARAIIKAVQQPAAPDIDALAQFIRRINGNNTMGAGVLAERICEWLGAQPQPAVPVSDKDAERYRKVKSLIGIYSGWWQVQIRAPQQLGGEDLEYLFDAAIDAAMAQQAGKEKT